MILDLRFWESEIGNRESICASVVLFVWGGSYERRH
jgi:hypothetical protein